MTKDELIAKLEAATGPLDNPTVAEILATVRGKQIRSWSIATGDAGEDEMQIYCTDGTVIRCSEFDYPDRSIDAALALVPDDHDPEIKRAKHRKGWRVNLWQADGIGQSGDAPTAPLAICIAALRARP